MKKFYLFAMILSSFLCADTSVDKLFKDVKTPLPCDLNKEICASMKSGEKIDFQITPTPILAMKESVLSVSGFERELSNPTIQITGISMFMGNFKANLTRLDERTYSAKIMVAPCVSPIMRYKIEVFDNGVSTGHFVYFDLHKSANFR